MIKHLPLNTEHLTWMLQKNIRKKHPLPFLLEAVKKLQKGPLTLPSPARGEGKYIEIQEEFPSPSMGEGQGGGENGIFSHLQGIEERENEERNE